MDFNLTEEQLMIQQAARILLKSELLPGVIEEMNFQSSPQSRSKKWQSLVLWE
jgi:hypothetical protein